MKLGYMGMLLKESSAFLISTQFELTLTKPGVQFANECHHWVIRSKWPITICHTALIHLHLVSLFDRLWSCSLFNVRSICLLIWHTLLLLRSVLAKHGISAVISSVTVAIKSKRENYILRAGLDLTCDICQNVIKNKNYSLQNVLTIWNRLVFKPIVLLQ